MLASRPSIHPEAAPSAGLRGDVGDADGIETPRPSARIDPIAFRDGLFALRTRRFGKVCEMMIEKLTGAGRARNIFHDLFDDAHGERIEVKFSTVNASHEGAITSDTLFSAVAAASAPRAVAFDEWPDRSFDCNIQQVKPAEFDLLYYGLFFRDRVVIFRMRAQDLMEDPAILYCDRQHKGNVGEGQFHLTPRTIAHHLERYHLLDLSYRAFIELFDAT